MKKKEGADGGTYRGNEAPRAADTRCLHGLRSERSGRNLQDVPQRGGIVLADYGWHTRCVTPGVTGCTAIGLAGNRRTLQDKSTTLND